MIRPRTSFVVNRICVAAVIVALSAPAALATEVTFTYTQADAATGVGTIAPFSFDDGGGPILFGATPMPAAIVINPNPGLTPAGYVGAQNAQSGAANEANTSVGLTFPTSVVATGVRGANIYEMVIPLTFVPEVNQTPTDLSDYTWNVTYGDAPTSDTVSSAALRFAMWLSRDDVIDAAETPNTFQRYTQQNLSFVAGPDAFVNTDISSTAIKEATDVAGAPAGTDAAGRPLAFYFGWRDTGGLTSGAVLVNDFTIGGLLNTNDASLRLIPEPGTIALACFGALVSRSPRVAASRSKPVFQIESTQTVGWPTNRLFLFAGYALVDYVTCFPKRDLSRVIVAAIAESSSRSASRPCSINTPANCSKQRRVSG